MAMRERAAKRSRSNHDGLEVQRSFEPLLEAQSRCYRRERDLPRVLAVWPQELKDDSPECTLRMLAKLRRALRAERRRGLAGHWSYELSRHLALLSAYRGELAGLRAKWPKLEPSLRAAVPPNAAEDPRPAGHGGRHPSRQRR